MTQAQATEQVTEQAKPWKVTDWHGLYKERWGQEIVPDAYAHPAKFARGLIRRIYDHLVAEGYLKLGGVVVDPFGGVALDALDAMRCGCLWVGCELESKFVKLGRQNITRWLEWYKPLWPDTWGTAILFQRDSRHLSRIPMLQGARARGVIGSPPYIGALGNAREYTDEDKATADAARDIMQAKAGKAHNTRYSPDPHNLGNLPEGDLQAVVSSPPWVSSENVGLPRDRGRDTSDPDKHGAAGPDYIVPRSPGQLAAMPEGDHAQALVSSPPWESVEGSNAAHKHADPEQVAAQREADFLAGRIKGNYASKEAILAQLQREEDRTYGTAPGQLGNDTGSDFWHAARAIVDQCYQVLAPGAVAVWVVKRFVRNKEIVPFPDQWRQMCEAAGFETVEWVRAWVVEEHGEQVDLWGNGQAVKKERKSFFRRLYESKYPENAIDWEDVIIMVRP